MKKQTIVLLSAVALLLAFVAGAWWFQDQQAEKIGSLAREKSSTLVPDHAMTLGSEGARVTIVEFFDPACETCATFYTPVKELMAAHPGRIRLVLRNAPFHQGSDEVVKILEASREQDRYWETLELLYASQRIWASHHAPRPDLVWKLLPRAGVDVDRIRAEMGGFALASLIQQDLADAATLGVRKTPGFFVNGKPLVTFGLPQLQALIEAEIAANY